MRDTALRLSVRLSNAGIVFKQMTYRLIFDDVVGHNSSFEPTAVTKVQWEPPPLAGMQRDITLQQSWRLYWKMLNNRGWENL